MALLYYKGSHMEDRDKMTKYEENFIKEYFDEKFKHLKELLIVKITENQKDIKDHTKSIKELQIKTVENTIEIGKIKNHLKEEKEEKEKNTNRKLKLKYLWLGIPVAIIIFIMQLGIQYILKLFFP